MFSNPTLSFLKTLIKGDPLRKRVMIALSSKEKSKKLQRARSKSPAQGHQHCRACREIASAERGQPRD